MNYKDQLKALGITVKFLAIKIGVSQSTMSYYVNNTRPIPPNIEFKMREILEAVGKIA